MSSLTPLSFGYHEPKKLVKKRLDVYTLMVEESSLAQHLKASVMRQVLILAMRLRIYMKKTV